MSRRRLVTNSDYEKLSLLFVNINLKSKLYGHVDQLSRELLSAKMFPPEEISGSVITMNSRVILMEQSSGKEIELTITYPGDADIRERKISIFSEVGVALLGRMEGDVVTWKIPGGQGQFEIRQVIYQPEAVGDYSL